MIYMKYLQILSFFFAVLILLSCTPLSAIANELAREIIDLNAEDVSYALEAQLPDLELAYISTSPTLRGDGIPVGLRAF